MNPLDLVILSLATWYLAYALTKSSGPFALFASIRTRFPLGGLTTCIVCASVWIAAAFALLWFTPAKIAVYPFAIAGLALMAGNWTGSSQQ